ncbi:MAG: hypothetical protein Q9221_006844 [Calogaya cf. arnoldii]
MESTGVGTLKALPGVFTGKYHADQAQVAPPTIVRQFLNKCLNHPNYFFELDQLQQPLAENVNTLLRQLDRVLEETEKVTFKMRFAKLAWYRSYRQFAMAHGFTLGASIDSSGAFLPRLVTDGIDEFIEHVQPDANQSGRGWIHQMTLAGFRYDYLTRDAQINPHSEANDGYLFLIPGSISFHHVGYQQRATPLAIEPPPECYKTMLDYMSLPSIPGQNQQNSVGHNQQPQPCKKAVVHHNRTTQQQQLLRSAFANGSTRSVVEPPQPRPQTTGQLLEGKRPSETILSGEQGKSGFLNNAETLAATAESEAQGYRLPPGRYLGPKNPLNPDSLPKVEKPKSRRLTKLERSRLSQQQQSTFREANHGPTVLEKENLDCIEIAETSSPSLDNMEQQQPQTFQRTSDALDIPTIPYKRTAQMVPRTPGPSLPQTPPQSLEISQQQKMQNNCDAYIQQCYGISPSQDQDQDQDQEQLPSSKSADQAYHHSDPKPNEQFSAQQDSVSDNSHETIDTQIAQTKREKRTAPTSPTSDNDESEVVKKSNLGITKHRRRTRARQEESIHVVEVDEDEDENEEAEKDTRKTKKLKTYAGRRRVRGPSST